MPHCRVEELEALLVVDSHGFCFNSMTTMLNQFIPGREPAVNDAEAFEVATSTYKTTQERVQRHG